MNARRPRRRRRGGRGRRRGSAPRPEGALSISEEAILANAVPFSAEDLDLDLDLAGDAEEGEAEEGPREYVPTGDPVRDSAARLGIYELRPEQERVIGEVQAGRDVLMILPTGFGKSACYQVPSMVLPKPVVVVSPLLALLKDQQSKLEARGIPCVRLDGSVTGKKRKAALARIGEGGSLLVMTTPETLATTEARDALTKSGVSLLAVDEAHCLSEWGHDFRPAYLRLGQQVAALGDPPVLALTATATERVREAIVRSLRMEEPTVVAASPHRSNLAFEVLRCEGDARLRVVIRLAQRLRRPGIIYCATRREVDLVYTLLRRFGIPAHRYHGGMTNAERNEQQEQYMRRGRRTVMVATSAFGLGIDKPDIRYVVHFQGPASLEEYVQEAGRGGRDGRKANCILLFDPADRSIHEALLARSRVRPEQLYRLGAALAAWSGEDKTPTLEALALSAELGPRIAAALLAKVEEAGLASHEGHDVKILAPADTVEEQTRTLAGQFTTLRTQDGRRLDALEDYADSTECRAITLRRYFGEEGEDRCGLCDLCQERPERPEGFFAPLNSPTRPGRGLRRPKHGRGRRSGRGGRRGEERGEIRRDGHGEARRDTGRAGQPRAGEGGDDARREGRRRRGGRRGGRRRGGRGRRGGSGGRGPEGAGGGDAPSTS